MQCPRCRHENPARAKFCLECGQRLASSCGACGTELPDTARFCPECGRPVIAGAAAPSALAPPEAPTPATCTPRHLAERILTSRNALEGERKRVTVRFCDLVGSTALAERLGAEGMHVLVNAFFEAALAEVHRYEGTVNQFLGDGFMALFGAPLAHEDHARRAALAALGLARALRDRPVAVAPGTEVSLSRRLACLPRARAAARRDRPCGRGPRRTGGRATAPRESRRRVDGCPRPPAWLQGLAGVPQGLRLLVRTGDPSRRPRRGARARRRVVGQEARRPGSRDRAPRRAQPGRTLRESKWRARGR
jgi:Double zinc ribbon/Adenylate and Guanylate cyclase catalytic domain